MQTNSAQQRDVNISGVLKAENFRTNEWQAIVSKWHPLFRNIASVIVSTSKENRDEAKNLLSVLNTGEDRVNESATQFALDISSLSDETLQKISQALDKVEMKSKN